MNKIFVGVGACAIDTILTVPYFPEQDSKLRALSCIKRRGGNVPNTLEVLQQLQQIDNHRDRPQIDLKLVATLPAASSPQISFIKSSFEIPSVINDHDIVRINKHDCAHDTIEPSSRIDLSHCIYREYCSEPVSSYIISDASTGSRTIVNHNDLQEMTFDEFKVIADRVVDTKRVEKLRALETEKATPTQLWYHFEGRIPETTLKCMQYLRQQMTSTWNNIIHSLVISVELEKPKREGLQDLIKYADFVFCSRSWAEGEGYGIAEHCIFEQEELMERRRCSDTIQRAVYCTWGVHGSYGKIAGRSTTPTHQPAFQITDRSVVDTVGAGDTFNAGILYALLNKSGSSQNEDEWTLSEQLRFANQLAGYKVHQQGFHGLANQFLNGWKK